MFLLAFYYIVMETNACLGPVLQRSFSLRKKYINNKQGESHGKQFVYQAKGLWTPIEPLKHAKTSS